MKKIEAIIKPFKLERIKDALAELGINGLTVSEVKACGPQNGCTEIFRGSEHKRGLLPKIKLEVVVKAELVQQAVDAVLAAAGAERVGEGKVFVSPVDDVLRIRTNESGEGAV
jgi:nitrogen regulatory protein P-II 1